MLRSRMLAIRRNMSHYNLDMIIAVGFRVKSQVATRFRQWATIHLREFIQKSFTLDDDRLKGKGSRYFRELLQRIRDIRSSERNLYQQVTDIFATSIDYDPQDNLTRMFFATVQKAENSCKDTKKREKSQSYFVSYHCFNT